MKKQRYLRWFSKQDDSLVGEYPFSCEVTVLQGIYSASSDDPMIFCYPVTNKNIGEIKKLVRHEVCLDDYDYFIEYDRLI